MKAPGRPQTRQEDQCGWVITRFKYQGSVCGRPSGHDGQHKSREAMAHASALSGLDGTARHRDWRYRLKAQFFEMYGKVCACCRTSENLTLDHALRDGTEHKERLGYGRTNWAVYRDAIAEYRPDRYRVLCGRCNASAGQTPGNQCRLDHSSPVAA